MVGFNSGPRKAARFVLDHLEIITSAVTAPAAGTGFTGINTGIFITDWTK
jgi:hypothetical protein